MTDDRHGSGSKNGIGVREGGEGDKEFRKALRLKERRFDWGGGRRIQRLVSRNLKNPRVRVETIKSYAPTDQSLGEKTSNIEIVKYKYDYV